MNVLAWPLCIPDLDLLTACCPAPLHVSRNCSSPLLEDLHSGRVHILQRSFTFPAPPSPDSFSSFLHMLLYLTNIDQNTVLAPGNSVMSNNGYTACLHRGVNLVITQRNVRLLMCKGHKYSLCSQGPFPHYVGRELTVELGSEG